METDTKKVYNKYKKIFKNIGKEKLKINDDLLRNIAFMTTTLQKLQNEIDQKGVTEHFEQGAQNFLRENPALKSYNTTIKNYTSAIKLINDFMPENKTQSDVEDIYNFVVGGSK